MPVDPRLQELIDRWEDLQEQGQEVSAQELCSEHPELLDELKRQIKALKAMSWLLESDPPTDGSGDPKGASASLPPTLGRYRLGELVGAGGFGQVWKGYDPELRRVVAIKVPQVDRLSPERAGTFVEEARKVARLRHPGIVPVHDVGKDGDHLFIVSDFIEGGNLADRLKAGLPTWQETARLIADVAEILDYAHGQGFIHRDIKPANILLDQTGKPYLTDFGIAATKEELHAARGQSIGTLAYMSPEQVLGQPVDARADIYALGVVLFEMLMGQRPFSGRDSRDLREQILSATPTFAEAKRRAIPAELEQVCARCLQREPGQRYAAAAELAAALRDVLTKSGQQRRHRADYVVGLLSLFGVIVLGLAGYWMMARSGRTSPPAIAAKDAQQLMVHAGSLFELNKFQEAVAAYTEVIRQAPEQPEAYHRRGACYYNLGELDKALADFNRALELAPNNAEAYKHRALVLLRQGQYDKGLADAEEGLRLDPAHAASYSSVMAMGYFARA